MNPNFIYIMYCNHERKNYEQPRF